MERKKRILLTGMSGVGKSALLEQLRDGGTLCLDLDEEGWKTPEGLFRIERILAWMDAHPDRNLVLAGCEENQGALYPFLDAVLLLTAPPEVMRERIRTRKNPYGKRPEEWNRIAADKERFEPLIARGCTAVIDTGGSLDAAAEEIRRFLRETA